MFVLTKYQLSPPNRKAPSIAEKERNFWMINSQTRLLSYKPLSINLRVSVCFPIAFYVKDRLLLLISLSGCLSPSTLLLVSIICNASSLASSH
jgi:hypothetical protein